MPDSSDSQAPFDSNQVCSASKTTHRFRPGDVVRVVSAQRVRKTLDSSGCHQGLPFMPEMLEFCGRSFRIKRIANKTCVDGSYVGELQDVFVLQTDRRCDGSSHGGCQMACDFFWKRAWLEPASQSGDHECEQGKEQLSGFLLQHTTTRDGCFRCQSTELSGIVRPGSALRPGQYLRDMRSGVSALNVGRFVTSVLLKKLLRKPDGIVGPCRGRTPLVRIGLQIGDRVRVKSLDEIRMTLDEAGCNRGLWFDPAEMSKFCQKEMVVSRVIERLIDETTGQLKVLKVPSIVLAETECSGIYRRFCARGMLHFWREAWLEKL